MFTTAGALALASIFSSAASYPSPVASDPSSNPYVAPGPGDVRSPCPALNTMANHGFLPHNGKGMTLPILTKGLADGLSIGPDFTAAIGGAGLLSNPNQNPLSPYFDLDQLDLHNFPIEHDASLSRLDATFGSDQVFNQDIWNSVLAYVPADQDFTIENAAKARYSRVSTERGRDPNFTYLPQHFIFSYGETALYLSTMGSSVVAQSAPREYVRMFFEQEKLPYEQGWTPPEAPITLASLAAMAVELNAAAGEEIPEGLTITESTLKAVFSGLDPLTGLLANTSLPH